MVRSQLAQTVRISKLLLLGVPVLISGWLFLTPSVAKEPLWQQLAFRKRVEADPNANYNLTKQHGPWLIMAASFSGQEGQTQALDLVLEMRRRYSIPAYYYRMAFKQDDLNPGRGIDQYGGTIKRRFQRGRQVVEHAVLIGEFPTIDDPEGQKLLTRVKTLEPNSLESTAEDGTSQSLSTVRRYHDQLKKQLGYSSNHGSMGHAFFTRNPMLPREYFVPQGVDQDVAKWNKGLEYSLLKCPGKFSMKVATFRGRSTIKQVSDNDTKKKVRKAADDDPLVIAARKAHLLTIALREKGWEAYEFHDRHESYVTVGSFEEGRQVATGKIVLSDREAKIIFNTFGAHSPENVFNRPAPQDKMLERQQKQRFGSLLSGGLGNVAEGFHPKRFVGMPFDIVPEAVEAPKLTVSSSYVRSFRFGAR
ncbi:MAG: hypothetical protein ABGX16_03175 [Pirellulales bacterium]